MTYNSTNYTAARNPNLKSPLSQNSIAQGVLGSLPRRSKLLETTNRTSFRAQQYTETDLGRQVVVTPNKPSFTLCEVFVSTLVDDAADNLIYVEEYKEGSWQKVKDQDILTLVAADASMYILAFTPTEALARVKLDVSGDTNDIGLAAYILQP